MSWDVLRCPHLTKKFQKEVSQTILSITKFKLPNNFMCFFPGEDQYEKHLICAIDLYSKI